MITYEYVLKKLAQKKQQSLFRHKVKYGRVLPEQWGYDWKGHQEQYQRLKQNPDQLLRDAFRL